MEYARTGSLSLSFTDYRIKTVYVDCRMDYISIIEAIGSTLEEIKLDISPSNQEEPVQKALFTAIRNHCVNFHTLLGVPSSWGGQLDIMHASLLISYGDKIQYADFDSLNTELYVNCSVHALI